jgi:hypothetical protein
MHRDSHSCHTDMYENMLMSLHVFSYVSYSLVRELTHKLGMLAQCICPHAHESAEQIVRILINVFSW